MYMNKFFSASVICMDQINLGFHVNTVDTLDIDFLHIDMMDGHNVPRYGLYPEQLCRINDITNMKLDVHLMTSDPEFSIQQLKNVRNIENLVFHIEGREGNIIRIIDAARSISKSVGIAVNMSTSPDIVRKLLRNRFIDSITFMAIHPGVLVQNSRPELLFLEIRDTIAEFTDRLKYISVDGGVKFSNIKSLLTTGANVLVGGSGTLYKDVSFTSGMYDQFVKISENWNLIKNEMSNEQ